MKTNVPSPVAGLALVASVLIAGCGNMGQQSSQTVDMPAVEQQRICEIQRQWNAMSPDEQSAALNFHMRNLARTYSQQDIDALRQRVRTAKC
jgi:hypothetical protein